MIPIPPKRIGFSLIELMVALAILAAVTTVALRSVSGLQDQARYQATTRSLNDIQAAIVGPANQRNPDGTALVTGFVADTGRLPQFYISASDPLGANGDPLNELIANPNNLPSFRLYSSNIDSTIRIWAGWQGPYLRLNAGPAYIRDGWGSSLHAYDSSGNLITTAGAPIAQLASWAADKQADVNHRGAVGLSNNYSDDVSVPGPVITGTSPGFASAATIIGQVTMSVGNDPAVAPATQPTSSGPPPNPTYSGNPVSIWVDYVGPDVSQTPPVVDVPVLVAVGSSSVSTPWTNYWNATASSPSSAFTGQFSISATIGPRVLKAYVLPATVTSTTGTGLTAFNYYVSNASSSHPIYVASTAMGMTLVGGGQTIPNLVLPHYSP